MRKEVENYLKKNNVIAYYNKFSFIDKTTL